MPRTLTPATDRLAAAQACACSSARSASLASAGGTAPADSSYSVVAARGPVTLHGAGQSRAVQHDTLQKSTSKLDVQLFGRYVAAQALACSSAKSASLASAGGTAPAGSSYSVVAARGPVTWHWYRTVWRSTSHRLTQVLNNTVATPRQQAIVQASYLS